MQRTLKLAGGALNQTPLDWEINLRNIKSAIDISKEKGVEILLLPELCITGYGCEDMFLSPWVWEKSVEKLLEVVDWTDGITVALGLPLMHGNMLRNTACLISNKKILGFWAKQFMALDGIHYEPRWFHPWPAGEVGEIEIGGGKYPIGDVVYDLPGGVKVGFEICEDAWRPERPAFSHKKRGVNLILNPSASHFAFGKTRVREEVVAVKASQQFNCVYIYANLLGNESGRIVYDGEVMIAQYGELVQKNNLLSFADIDVAMADVDIDGPKAKSSHPIEYASQDKCEEFIAALCLALFDYCRKSRSNGFVLSLSGGADSSVCAVAVAEMVRRAVAELGINGFAEKMHLAKRVDVVALEAMPREEACKVLVSKLLVCAYQSTGNSSDATFTSAKELALSIGAVFHDWSIDDEVAGYIGKIEKSIGRKLTWQTDDITLQNIQARVRAPAIWMLANINYSLLMATSNRSEASV
ncbi:MAG: NAD+ synthetase, partial [Moraxellaceae bacterium]